MAARSTSPTHGAAIITLEARCAALEAQITGLMTRLQFLEADRESDRNRLSELENSLYALDDRHSERFQSVEREVRDEVDTRSGDTYRLGDEIRCLREMLR